MRKIGSDQVTCFPNGIDISDAGDVLIGDSHGNKFHVAVYDNKANCASQFECPHVKVPLSNYFLRFRKVETLHHNLR